MSLWFTKKDREIANLKAKVENRDKLIEDQARTIEGLKSIINSLEEDLQSVRCASYEKATESTTNNVDAAPVRKRAKRATTKKETTSKTSTSKK